MPPAKPRPAAKFRTRRRLDYPRRLLPSPYLAKLEPEELRDPRTATRLFTGRSIGYPAWNLLYYSLLCSLPGDPDAEGPLPAPLRDDVVAVETGTNRGASTIVMAQALKDVHLDAVVHTVDREQGFADIAKQHVALAGLSDYVRFNVEDSLTFLSRIVEEKRHIDFIFIDDNHSFEHVVEEFSIIHPALLLRRGKAYFDNTSEGGVADALESICANYGGNLVRFENCSWRPPGNAIWQPS